MFRAASNYILIGVFLAGCASRPSDPVFEQTESCRPNSTLVCEQRMGKIIRCSCNSKDEIRDILEPQ